MEAMKGNSVFNLVSFTKSDSTDIGALFGLPATLLASLDSRTWKGRLYWR